MCSVTSPHALQHVFINRLALLKSRTLLFPCFLTHRCYSAIFTLQLKLRIDDPLDSAAVHAGNGFLGMILVAFVAKPAHVAALTGTSCGGIFYTSAGWMQLAMQLLGKECDHTVT